MSAISYASLLVALEKNVDVDVISPKPSCPKNADAMCLALMDNCDSGNKKRCEQWLEFYYKSNSIYRLKVMFKVSSSVNDGYVRLEDMQVRKMFQKEIVKKDALQQLEL
ncbi:MAG: hypothetical protein HDR34_01670 [Treponema sp.]|nr:hypothetical protein [Treponema sp.]